MLRPLLVLSLLAACGDSGGFPDAAKPDSPYTGTFSLTWSVIDQNSAPLPCERIAAQAMTVLAHNKAFEGGATQIFTCATGMGMSQGVFAGLYDLNFELSGTFGLLARGPTQTNVEVPAFGNVVLEPLVFQVEAIGGLELKLASNKPAGNCGASNAGGAGIDGFTITLTRNSDATCTPVTLAISQGATRPGGTYVLDCTTPVQAGCIEADQVLSASSMSSDAYTIHVRGLIGTKSCWINDDMIQVPPLQKTLVRTLNLAQQTQTAGC